MQRKEKLRISIMLSIALVGLKAKSALRKADLTLSFLTLTKDGLDINPRINNLSRLCTESLGIYPSDLFHPALDKEGTKRLPHPPRKEVLGCFSIIDEDFALAFKNLLDKKLFVKTFRYETYYGLTAKPGWPQRIPTVLATKNYLSLQNISLYEFFKHVEEIAWARIRKERAKSN